LHAERLADVVDDVLIGRRLSPPGASSPVKNASTESTSGSPPVDIFHPAAFAQLFGDFGAAGPCGRSVTVHVQGRGRGLHGFFERPSRPLEPRHLRGGHLRGLRDGRVF
jgi:hypothetical protein